MPKPRVTLHDLAKALNTSIGTVHRALHDSRDVSAATKAKVLRTAKALGYRPNLAARYLSSKKTLRISVNTLQGTTSFWDEVRAGISEEAGSPALEHVELDFKTYSHLGDLQEEVFEDAISNKVDGVITFPSHPKTFRPWIRRATRAGIPVVCAVTDAPDSGRIGLATIDTLASGSLAADLMGKFIGEQQGCVAITLFDTAITEHAQKSDAFERVLRSFYPQLRVLPPVEDHGMAAEAYHKCRTLFEEHPDVRGVYVTTEGSIPVLKAAKDADILNQLTFITTDLFADLVPQIRSGTVAATIYQRPRSQGRMAFRVLWKHLSEGGGESSEITLAPHLVMRGNLDFFLQRQSRELAQENSSDNGNQLASELA
jgi:LacI family transcriptional regulator